MPKPTQKPMLLPYYSLLSIENHPKRNVHHQQDSIICNLDQRLKGKLCFTFSKRNWDLSGV